MDKNDNGKKTVGERHIFTQIIMQLLMAVEIGEIITYEQLEKEIDIDCRPQKPGYGYQYTARIILEREENMVFEAVTKVGLKRLPPEDVAQSSVQCITKPLRSHLDRQKRRVDTLNESYSKLTPSGRFCVDTARTLLVFAKGITRKKSVGMIEAQVEKTKKAISMDETLALFMPKKAGD